MSKIPPGWGTDLLTAYLDQARSNQIATFANKKAAYSLMSEIDSCFVRGVKDMINPKDMVAPLTYMRAHSAWRTACGTAMAGQLTETYALLRLALEFAAYSLFMSETPGMTELWLKRNDDEAAKRKMRDAFKLSVLRETIEKHDRKLADVFQHLYELSIDQGAHPNQFGVTGSTQIKEGDDRKVFEQIYLHGDGVQMDATLKVVVEVGICCLLILQHIATFTTRFQLLGLRDRINELREKSSILVVPKVAG